MRVLFFFVTCGLCFLACKKEVEPLPVSLEKAAQIIIDTHTAEAALQSAYGTKKDSLAVVYYAQIYEVHGIDSTTFKALMQILRNDPDRLSEVYRAAFQEFEERPNAPK